MSVDRQVHQGKSSEFLLKFCVSCLESLNSEIFTPFQVVEEPSDPTKIILRVTKPPQLAFGRLKFYRRGADGKPSGTPYGFRYPLIVPEKPQLRWHTVSENASSNIYQIPIDGKVSADIWTSCVSYARSFEPQLIWTLVPATGHEHDRT